MNNTMVTLQYPKLEWNESWRETNISSTGLLCKDLCINDRHFQEDSCWDIVSYFQTGSCKFQSLKVEITYATQSKSVSRQGHEY